MSTTSKPDDHKTPGWIYEEGCDEWSRRGGPGHNWHLHLCGEQCEECGQIRSRDYSFKKENEQ